MAKRGGRRQGRPGVSYANRKDLNVDHMAPSSVMTPASGPPPEGVPDMPGGAASNVGQAPARPSMVYPEDVPSLTDPTARPSEPVTAGLGQMLPTPAPSYVNRLYGAYMANPTPELKNAIDTLIAKGVS